MDALHPQPEDEQAREEGEDDGDGQHEEDDGDHLRNLASASLLHEVLTRRLAHVGRLGPQDISQRCTALESHDDGLAQTSDVDGTDPPLHTVQGGGQDGAGADVGQGGTQLLDEIASPERNDAFDGGHGSLTGPHGQGEELDDVGQLGLDSRQPFRHGPAEPPVAGGSPGHGGQDGQDDECRNVDGPDQGRQSTGCQDEEERRRRPQDLLEAELVQAKGRSG